jgi:non-canonical purine NTP pyrophosphatase (RdgB/HAM1 family)
MQKKVIVYATTNKMKIDLIKSILNNDEFEIIGKNLDLPEIQADSIEEVAKFSAKYASQMLKCDVLKNDSGLIIPALNGFPSAYTKYVQDVLGPDGILALMKGKQNREAYYLDAYAYCEFGKEPIVFVSKTYGEIAKRKSGKNGFGYDKIFVSKGKQTTMANLTYEEFLGCFDTTGVNQLAQHLRNNTK